MSKIYPIIERLADEVIVTARSTVEAQQAAGEAMGGDCTIVSVERVREGGIGGFFSTELVRVTARPSRFHRADRELDAAMTSAEELVSSLRSSSPQFADRLMDELLHHRPASPPPADPLRAAPRPALDDRGGFGDDFGSDFGDELGDDDGYEALVADDARFARQLLSDDTNEIVLPREALAALELADAPVAFAEPVAPAGHRCAPPVEVLRASIASDRVQRDEQLERRLAQAISSLSSVTDPTPVSAPAPEMPRGNYGNLDRVPAIVPGRTASPQTDPRWSHQALRALGLPDRIVDLAMLQRPVEGPQWIMALMGAFRTICAPPPAGPTVLIGPSCANLARQLRLVSVGADELSESLSSVAIPNVSAGVARSALNDRFVHLMVGGSWQHLGSIRAHVVSAATDADVMEAVRVCCAWEATLGWTQVGDRYERLDEFTLVAHVRSILYGIDRPNTGSANTATASPSPVSPDSMLATFS